MSGLIYTILTGIIATLCYELLKKMLITIFSKIQETDEEFSISGTWCAYHERKSKKDGKIYYAYEFVELKKKSSLVDVRIWQINSKSERRRYKGSGYIRGSKISIAYKEVGRKNLTQCGTMDLKLKNIDDHNVVLTGNYHEFYNNEVFCSSYLYELREYYLSTKDKIKVLFAPNKYVFSLMCKDVFENECKKKM